MCYLTRTQPSEHAQTKSNELKRSIMIGLTSFLLSFGLVLMIVLLVLCANKEIAQNQYMITINSYTGKVADLVREQGRVNIAVGDEMVFFTRTVQSHTQMVECFSKDLIQISAQISVSHA